MDRLTSFFAGPNSFGQRGALTLCIVRINSNLQKSHFFKTHISKHRLVNARTMADVFWSGYNIVSGGTDNHLLLVDLIDIGINGKVVDAALTSKIGKLFRDRS